MAKSRARGRRRNAVVAESCRTPEASPLPCRPAGLFDVLPPELLDLVLDKCNTKQLAMLETSCSFFRRTNLIRSVAETRLRAIPRAKGTVPDPRSADPVSAQQIVLCIDSAALSMPAGSVLTITVTAAVCWGS